MDLDEFSTKCQILSHPIRGRIFLLSLEKPTIKVRDVADLFNIHPNLARGHLNALVKLRLLKSKYVNRGIGAPSKEYKASRDYICLNLPKCPLKAD